MQLPPAATQGTTTATVAARIGKETKAAAAGPVELQTVAASGPGSGGASVYCAQVSYSYINLLFIHTIFSMAECFQEKSSWRLNGQVCWGVKCKVLRTVPRPRYRYLFMCQPTQHLYIT